MGKGTGTGAGKGRLTICPAPKDAWETAKEWGNKILSGICCCLCTGPILTIIGIIFVISAIKDVRGDNIKKFNTGVAAWNSAGRAAWEARLPNFAYSGRTAAGNGSTVAPVTFVATTVDPVTTPTDPKVTPYQPLLFTSATATVPASFPVAGPAQIGVTGVLSVTSSGTIVTPDPAIPVFKLVTLSSGTSGTTTGSTTSSPPPAPSPPTPPSYKQQYTKTVCMMVSDSNSYFNVGGCFGFAFGGSQYAGGVWETADCTGATITDGSQNTVNGCFGFSGFAVQLRSQNDPMIQGFLNKACGSSPRFGCSFGLSRKAKLTIAFILLFIGIGWTCCVYGGLYAIVLYFHNKK